MSTNGDATQNKQVIGWAVSALAAIGMMLFQWAILGSISELRTDVSNLRSDMSSLNATVSSLNTAVSDIKQDGIDSKAKEQSDVDKLWTAQERTDDAIQGHDGRRR